MSVEAQKEFSNWYFGNFAGLNFNTEPTSFHLDGQTSLGNNPATISDSAGNLLFYFANGLVFNSNHEIMLNGNDMAGIPNQHGNLIIPKPNFPNIYYLIVSSWEPEEQLFPKIYLSEIDMSLDGNLGGVTSQKNQIVYSGPISLKLTAVQHANDIDFWIVGHGLNNADFLSFRVTENGFDANPVVSTIGSIHTFGESDFSGIRGGIKVSHDAKRIGTIFIESIPLDGENSNLSFLEVADFNDITGEVQGNVLRVGEDTFFNIATDDATGSAVTLEFSPDNNFVYVTCVNAFGDGQGSLYPSALFQFDVRATNDTDFLFSTAEVFSSIDRMYSIQLGLDEKIYVCTTNQEEILNNENIFMSLGVIENPNEFGLGANYRHLSVPLSDDQQDVRLAGIGLPQDIRQFFYLKIESEELCGGIARRFTLDTSNAIISVLWDFGDGTTSTDINPEHSFLPGVYSVSVTATYENSVVTRNILVQIPETLNLLTDEIVYCDDASNDGIVNVAFMELEDLIFRSEDCGITSFHFTENEAQTNSNPISEDFNITDIQTVYFRLEQEFNSSNVTITPITLVVGNFPELQNLEYNLCSEDNESLTVSVSEFDTLFSSNLECAMISYYETISNANAGLNPITSSLDLLEPLTTIYVRIFDSNNSTFTVTPIEIRQKNKPVLDLQNVYYICSNQDLMIDAGDGFDRYLWSTGETSQQITIDALGTYSVEVFNNVEGEDCSDNHNFTVQNSDLPETIDLIINDLSLNNSIEVLTTGIGNYEFSIDGFTYQDAPIFNNLTQSEYTVYIRDKNGCGVVTVDAFLLIQPKFFTPNQDGVNDFWQIKSAFSEPELKVEIYNRYGKLLIAFNGNSNGWDGTFNGLDLPTSDYWFKIYRPSKQKTYTGHFTLKR